VEYKDVDLLSIGQVRVYLPPNTKIASMLRKKYAHLYPPQPVKMIKLATGKGQPAEYEPIRQESGPEFEAWRAECDQLDDRRFEEANNLNFLFSLRDVVVPDDFDVEAQFGRRARFIDPKWKPTPGEFGRDMDYLEWIVLANSHDQTAVSVAMNQLLGLDQEVVDDVKDSFPDQVAG
jgi:hypothetical protein